MTNKLKPHDRDPKMPNVRAFPTFDSNNGDNFLGGAPAPEMLRDLCGTKTNAAGTGLLMSAMQALGPDAKDFRQFMTALWAEEEPKSAVEAMLVQQLGTIHLAISKLSMRFNSDIDLATQMALLKAINNSMRTAAELVRTLKKYRSAANQTVRIERVNVSDGGLAIVGDIHRGGDRNE
ncbi:MAG TPA: hypothetical protein QGF83_19380 [Sulfitobacter pontiacus]|uniref:hypothetical protein n=1 Tax=Sulfitobacter pontiacus TaxID=60137 RepID=UPI002AC25F54|nr:hypothetical protein [Sulfitobacter pontiacus]